MLIQIIEDITGWKKQLAEKTTTTPHNRMVSYCGRRHTRCRCTTHALQVYDTRAAGVRHTRCRCTTHALQVYDTRASGVRHPAAHKSTNAQSNPPPYILNDDVTVRKCRTEPIESLQHQTARPITALLHTEEIPETPDSLPIIQSLGK